MRLLTCHIENFGKLSDFSYDFTDGYNAIVLPNGAGKSTFAAFIRVMFYGFAGRQSGRKSRRSGSVISRGRVVPMADSLPLQRMGNIICCRVSSGRRQRAIPSGYRMRILCLIVRITRNRPGRSCSESMRNPFCGPSISVRRSVQRLRRQIV